MDYYQWMALLSCLGGIIAVAAAISAARRAAGTRGAKSAEGNSPEAQAVSAANSSTMSPAASDGALVAAISAAIYAATGAAPGSLRIATIQPSSVQEGGFNTPVWGRVERFAQR